MKLAVVSVLPSPKSHNQLSATDAEPKLTGLPKAAGFGVMIKLAIG